MHAEDFGSGYEGKCQACDAYGPVDDMSMCESCAGKFERDVVRLREWDYSASAFGTPKEALEALRDEVIKQYGGKLEMLAPPDKTKSAGASRPNRKKK